MEPSLPTVHYLVCLIIPYDYILVLLATGLDFAPAAVGFPVEKIRQEKKNTTGVVFSGSDFREKYDQKIRLVVFLKS